MAISLGMRESARRNGHQAPPREGSADYEGWVQGVVNGHVLGCCWEPGSPGVPVAITIVVDGEVACEGLADLPRPDLAADHGESARGFLVALPERLRNPGSRHSVRVLAGSDRAPIAARRSFWYDASQESGWSGVAFRADDAPSEAPLDGLLEDGGASGAVRCEGWLLDAAEAEPPRPADDAALDALAEALIGFGNACAGFGSAYIPVLIPRKRDVLGLSPLSRRGNLQALRARLREAQDVDLLDLLPVLRDAMRHGSVYHRTDVGFNDRGAFFAACALLKEARKRVPELAPPSLADLHLRALSGHRGALAHAPRLEYREGALTPCDFEVEPEDGVELDAHRLHAQRMPVETHLAQAGPARMRVYANSMIPASSHLAVVGEAAALSLVPWLAERAGRTAFLWAARLPALQLELELPSIVFHTISEMEIPTCSPRLVEGLSPRLDA